MTTTHHKARTHGGDEKFPGVYRGIVISADLTTLEIKCRVPAVTKNSVVKAAACIPPGWHDPDRDLLQDHPEHPQHPYHADHPVHASHGFTDFNDGTGSSGNHAQLLPHTDPNAGLHIHDGHALHSRHVVGTTGSGLHVHRLVTMVPRPGIEGVWIMYEAGVVEHPVWIGTYKLGGN